MIWGYPHDLGHLHMRSRPSPLSSLILAPREPIKAPMMLAGYSKLAAISLSCASKITSSPWDHGWYVEKLDKITTPLISKSPLYPIWKMTCGLVWCTCRKTSRSSNSYSCCWSVWLGGISCFTSSSEFAHEGRNGLRVCTWSSRLCVWLQVGKVIIVYDK